VTTTEPETIATRAGQLVNPMWAAVADQVRDGDRWEGGQQVGSWLDRMEGENWFCRRRELTSTYSWSLPDPATVAFVAEHAGPAVIDPLAGSGYWGYLLGQLGIDVACSDAAPPDLVENFWHKAGVTHCPVLQSDGVDAVTTQGTGRTLFLSWPPYDQPIGAQVVAAYPGNRLIYIGEGEGGCTGGDDLYRILESDWEGVTQHRPVQFLGLHDWVTVYDRKVP
jgi:hypothetical protein